MTRRILLAAFAFSLAGMVACGRSNRESVHLSTLCFPPTPDSNGTCSFSAGACNTVLANGHIFVDLVASGNTLAYPIQIDNLRTDNSDTTSGRTNTNIAFIDRFDMQYSSPGLTLPSASVNQSAAVPTAGSTVVVVELIPFAAGMALASTVPVGPTETVINVKAHGRYGDDTEFETAAFSVPVSIFNGEPSIVAEFACPTGTLPQACPQAGQTSVFTGCK